MSRCCFLKVLWFSDWKPSGGGHSSHSKGGCDGSAQQTSEDRVILHSLNVQAGASARSARPVCFHNVTCFSKSRMMNDVIYTLTYDMIYDMMYHMIYDIDR